MNEETNETVGTNLGGGDSTDQATDQVKATDNKETDNTKENTDQATDQVTDQVADKKNTDEKQDEEEPKNENFGKPESYDFKDVKVPEGMELDETMTGMFSEYASKLDLSQKSANEIMSMAVKLTEQTQKQTVEAIAKLRNDKIEGYKVLLNKDKEVGGANLDKSLTTANVAYDGFFQDEDLRVMLAEAGLTVHPKFIKALKAIGSQMEQDTIRTNGNASGESLSREDILFPSMDKKE